MSRGVTADGLGKGPVSEVAACTLDDSLLIVRRVEKARAGIPGLAGQAWRKNGEAAKGKCSGFPEKHWPQPVKTAGAVGK